MLYLINLKPDRWTIATIAVAFILSLPVLSMIYLAILPGDEVWTHLANTFLTDYIVNTLNLLFLVGIGSLVLGVSAAWIICMYDFPGRRIFEWSLLLPMAIPSYIIASVYVELFEYAGPVQKWLRSVFQWKSGQDYWFPEIRSIGGGAFMMILVLYPYVYMLSRASFMNQSSGMIEMSQVLGQGARTTFIRIALPLARPAIVLGLTLVLMETISDFGTVELFAIDTFTRGIYNVWLNMGNITGAAQLSVSLLVFVVLLIYLEKGSRAKQKFHLQEGAFRKMKPYTLGVKGKCFCLGYFLLLLVFGFALPFGLLLHWSLEDYSNRFIDTFYTDLANSFTLATSAAFISICIALFLASGNRFKKLISIQFFTRISNLGYAVPGPIIALGVLVPFLAFENYLDTWMRSQFQVSTGLFLTGTLSTMIFAYMVRFLAVSYGSIEAGLTKISQSMDNVARTLGNSPLKVIYKIHLPMLKSSIFTASILVFVDTLKELPITLILQPFNFSTLSTRIFEYASDERLQESAPWAVAIVLIGLIPVLILNKSISKSRIG